MGEESSRLFLVAFLKTRNSINARIKKPVIIAITDPMIAFSFCCSGNCAGSIPGGKFGAIGEGNELALVEELSVDFEAGAAADKAVSVPDRAVFVPVSVVFSLFLGAGLSSGSSEGSASELCVVLALSEVSLTFESGVEDNLGCSVSSFGFVRILLAAL